jgi:peptidoglycan/LPS O-acetylase OafA/YrhL
MRRADIQGLRAIAILGVVAFHAHLGATGGFVGVDVFFAISGFVITSTLVREINETGSLSLPGFYARRVRRLLPGLAAMLTTVALAGILLAPVAATHVAALTALAASVFGANFYLSALPSGYFDVSTSLDPLLHTWTLAVEEQFYLVYPVVLLISWRIGRRFAGPRTFALATITALSGASLLVALATSSSRPEFAFYASPARAWEFGAGVVTALLTPLWNRVLPVVCSAVGAVALTTIAASLLGGEAAPFALRLGAPVAATCVLLASGSRTNLIAQLLSLAPFRAIGDLSYSWYLWHWPLIVFARAALPGSTLAPAVMAFASLVPAWLSYRFVEQPIRFDRTVVRGRALAVAAVCIAVPVAAASTALVFRLPAAAAAYAPALHADVGRGCDQSASLGSPDRRDCTWRTRHSIGTVVLIGDSNAGHFTEGVVTAARRARLNVVVATQSACPFVALRLSYPGTNYAGCSRFDRESLAWLVSHKPNLVIISSRADSWIEDASYALAAPGSQLTSSPTEKQRLWTAGLRAEVSALTQAGIPSLVVHPVPRITEQGGDCAAVLTFLDRGCNGNVARSKVDRELRRTLLAEKAAVNGLNAKLLDLEPELCTRSRCSGMLNGVPMYRDTIHLSVVGSVALSPVFYRAIVTTARRKESSP